MSDSFLAELIQALQAPKPVDEVNYNKVIESITLLDAALKSGEKKEIMPKLNNLNGKILEPVVYLVNNTLSEADLILFDVLAPTVTAWTTKETHHFDNISRWYDNIQHQPQLQPIIEKHKKFVTFELDVPKPPSKEQKKQQQQQKTKAGQQQKGQNQPAKAEEKPEDIYRVEFKVGKIVDVERHPNAEFLYKELIDFGEDKPRVVVSGLVKYVPIEQMKDRFVVCVTNLKPANLKGISSEAMVLVASDTADQNKKELVDPPAGSAPGDRVYFEGHEGTPDAPINLASSNNIFKKLSVDLKTDDKCVAVWKGVPMRTAVGVITAKSVSNAPLG